MFGVRVKAKCLGDSLECPPLIEHPVLTMLFLVPVGGNADTPVHIVKEGEVRVLGRVPIMVITRKRPGGRDEARAANAKQAVNEHGPARRQLVVDGADRFSDGLGGWNELVGAGDMAEGE